MADRGCYKPQNGEWGVRCSLLALILTFYEPYKVWTDRAEGHGFQCYQAASNAVGSFCNRKARTLGGSDGRQRHEVT